MKLPNVIEKFIKATNENDHNAFVACFTEDATFHDEGETRKGKQAIGEWFKKSKSQYQQNMTPISVSENGNDIILKASVSGTFKGSPIQFIYSMKLKSGLIEEVGIGV